MWALPMVFLFSVASVACMALVIFEPPDVVARFLPRKVFFVFALLPAPWDRRIGMLVNAVILFAAAVFFAYYGYVHG